MTLWRIVEITIAVLGMLALLAAVIYLIGGSVLTGTVIIGV